MTLKGTLEQTTVAEVFQAASRQTTPGVLVFFRGERQTRVSFQNAAIVAVEEIPRDPPHLLGALMVRGGAITSAELDAALARQQSVRLRVGELLVDRSVVEPATIKQFTRLQATEALHRVFSLHAGSFVFLEQQVELEVGAHDPINVEQLLMDAMRMAEAWPGIRKLIPSSSELITVVGTAPTDLGDESQRRVAALVASGRTVAEIVDASRLGEFEATRALAELVRQGHVRVGKGALVADRARVGARRALAIARTMVVQWLFGGLTALGLFFVVELASTLPQGTLTPTRPESTLAAIEEALATTQGRRIENALAIHRVAHGGYPGNLDELVAGKLLEERDLTYPFAWPWLYTKTIGGYVLSRPLR
jgi:hypothetical protein